MSIEDFPARPRYMRAYEAPLKPPPSLGNQLGIGFLVLVAAVLAVLVLSFAVPVANELMKSAFEDLYRQGKVEFTYNRIPA